MTKRVAKKGRSHNRLQAAITVRIYQKGIPYPQPIHVAMTTMTSDLPADNLGEILCEAIQGAWKAGHDPVDCIAVVEFT